MEVKNDEALIDELDSYKGQWFVINCNSGHEDRVREDLMQKMESPNLADYIFDIRISKCPSTGKTGKTIEKNKFPGYIFINMIMTEETWFIIRNTPGVTGFIGSSGKGTKPHPLTSEEVSKMLNVNAAVQGKNAPKTPKKEKQLFIADFKEDDYIKIISGVFEGKEGQVIKMDYEKGIAIVNIEMFGRYTPSEVNFADATPAY